MKSAILATALAGALLICPPAQANPNVYVSRFWHNHQPIYWPEWNGNGSQTERVQYAWDSIVLKGGQTYGTGIGHPDNNLTDIFGNDDRRAAYQGRPRDALAGINSAGGFAISYSGSLMDNVRNLGGAGQLGYGGGWWDGNREASGWTTPAGSRRLDLVGFTYHHSLGAVLPKEVFRKELQIFKQAWWKAWNKNANLSDHSKGFFPTEMAFSPTMIDVLVDEGYQWSIVASHHLSRTCPTYFNHANPTGTYNIYSSPPNRADQLGPSPTAGWWYNMPNPGQGSWNVSPYAYQLQRAKYVNPSNGTEKTMILVPSDDTLSYQAGYSGAQLGIVGSSISPQATDPARPVLVMPSTDGDNAWGGGFSSWMESVPSYFSGALGAGYRVTTPQDFVNQFGAAAPTVHVEDGAWIFPETDYGSPYFLKWVEPPLRTAAATNTYPGTMVDLETPGFALKFWSWAPVIAGANWCETAEQIHRDAGGSVAAWKIQSAYDWNGSYNSPNVIERAWHIYLAGLDSGFNYYGGLGNDDEVKQTLATRRAVEMLQSHLATNLVNDRTAPTVFKPQRFPWNPGAHTFGWFNSMPGGGTNSAYLKKMPSEFYVWTHAFDVSGITSLSLKVRLDHDGANTLANNQNETFAGGGDVGGWVSVAMTRRVLPSTSNELNAAANNGQIGYFITPPTGGLADYYFAKITDASVPGFRGKLLDYYIEAMDTRGNVSKSDIQHVFVENDGQAGSIPSSASFSADPRDCAPLTVTYVANGGPLSNSVPVELQLSFNGGTNWSLFSMTHLGGGTSRYTTAGNVPDNAPSAIVWFQSAGGGLVDSRSGANWSTPVRDCDAPVGPAAVVFSNAPACDPVTVTYYPNVGVLQTATQLFLHLGYGNWSQVVPTQAMARVSNNIWRITVTPPPGAAQLDAVFHNGAGTWDNHGGGDWHFPLTACVPPPLPAGITITNPPAPVSVGNEVTLVSLQGQAGTNVVGLMAWTNSLTGDAGWLSASPAWSLLNVPLGVGANVITLVGTNSGEVVATNAADSGSEAAYADGWSEADNGGSGFGAWALSTSSTNGSENGRFMATSAAVSVGTPAWGLYANSSNFAEARRWLAAPLATGQTVALQFDHGYIDPARGVGVALLNAGGDTLWQFYFNGGNTNYNLTGSQSDLSWSPGGFAIEFTLTGPTSYLSRITPLGGSTRTNSGSLAASTNPVVALFKAWNFSAGSGSDYDVFFNHLRVLGPGFGSGSSTSAALVITRLPGVTDSDGDGIPDAWEQAHFGSSTGAAASVDSDGDGVGNWEEFITDMVPTNAASVFTNEIVGVAGTGVFQLTVPAPTTNSRIYDAWFSLDLAEGLWQPVNLNVPGRANGTELLLTVTNSGPERFYRTGVKLP